MSAVHRPLGFDSPEHRTFTVVAGGWARSGKGTSMAQLKGRLEQAGKRVELIDQGLKFRALGEVALAAGRPLDSPAALNDFMHSPRTQAAALTVLAEVSAMNEADKKARLYTPAISTASGKIGKVPGAHRITTSLLRNQFREAVEDKKHVVLIDGRSMEKYAREFEAEGLAGFVMGWYFTCDPAIAARRSLGLFDEYDSLPSDDRMRLLAEILSISDRNRSDSLRDVDPLREPHHAYRLDLSTYDAPDSDVPYKRGHDATRAGMAIVDTSYTNSIEQMTYPITEVSMYALLARGAISHEAVGIQVIRNVVQE